MKDRKIWFPKKKYGYGWGLPITWQGWAVFLAYITLILLGTLFIRKSPVLIIPFVIYVGVLSGIFIYICWKTGEKLDI